MHVILDNRPFQEYFSPQEPLVLSQLSPGSHVLAVFPVTTWHESWKDDEALALLRFHVDFESPEPKVDLSGPLLIFNMPQGVVEKEEKGWVFFDFLTANIKVDASDNQMEGYRIRYFLDGAATVTEYREARLWLNLSPGHHRLVVGLTDAYGRLIANGGWNRINRSFDVKEVKD